MIYFKNNYLSPRKQQFISLFVALLVLVISIVYCPVAYSQTTDSVASTEQTQTTDTAYSNKTMKSVFKELKHITKTGNATLNSILMILGVVSVVAIAMYLSFRNDPEEENA
jgi:TRAP-type C4-dicarboxylate transport system permease small subunit